MRIALVHALFESIAPAQRAFAAQWPEVKPINLLDDSLSCDIAQGASAIDFTDRMIALADYHRNNGADAVLFTCSAFGDAIDAVKAALPIPVLKPDEAMLEEVFSCERKVGAIYTFAPTLDSLTREVEKLARVMGRPLPFEARLAEGALEAWKSGDHAEHDRRILTAAGSLRDCDILFLAQFSMAHMADAVAGQTGLDVCTAPEAAVRKLRRLLNG